MAELAPFASQDRLEDIQVKILNSVDLLKRLRRYRNLRLAHFDSELMEDVSLHTSEVISLMSINDNNG